jgi:Na+-translocating ferredoxin:NAD+ oxidoreductase subunit B
MKYHAAPASGAAAGTVEHAALAARIADLLPQTQCTKCGYAGCQPYAEAVAAGDAGYNQCPPGGQEGVARLAGLLGRPVIPLNPEHGVERARPLARIDESLCIGCTLCLQACPVDAIVGAAKQMHTVIEAQCTGCDLCVAPCPVDCISMIPVTGAHTGWDAWTPQQAEAARARHARHEARIAGARAATEARLRERDAARRAQAAAPVPPAAEDEAARKRAVIQAALERARLKKAELAAAGLGPRNTDDVSPAVQAQIDAAERRRRRLGLADDGAAELPATPNQDPDA